MSVNGVNNITYFDWTWLFKSVSSKTIIDFVTDIGFYKNL